MMSKGGGGWLLCIILVYSLNALRIESYDVGLSFVNSAVGKGAGKASFFLLFSMQVDEKPRLRDAIRVEIQSKCARLRAHNEAFKAAKQEETVARRLVRLKRQEIDSIQSVINRVENAESVEDINNRIFYMEHMIQYETLCLKDEKHFIREIKQLKILRDQLSLSMGSQDEIQQAIDQKDQTEERMRTLRKELDVLKEKGFKS